MVPDSPLQLQPRTNQYKTLLSCVWGGLLSKTRPLDILIRHSASNFRQTFHQLMKAMGNDLQKDDSWWKEIFSEFCLDDEKRNLINLTCPKCTRHPLMDVLNARCVTSCSSPRQLTGNHGIDYVVCKVPSLSWEKISTACAISAWSIYIKCTS